MTVLFTFEYNFNVRYYLINGRSVLIEKMNSTSHSVVTSSTISNVLSVENNYVGNNVQQKAEQLFG